MADDRDSSRLVSSSDEDESWLDEDDEKKKESNYEATWQLLDNSSGSIDVSTPIPHHSYRDVQTQPMTLTWHDLKVVLPSKKRLFRRRTASIEILKGISGIVRPGQLLAIMGASGCGKTTLLNVLTGRNVRHLSIIGQVKVNGVDIGQDGISNISAYVQQEDLFVGVLTVRQHLWFQAMLRMDQHTTIAQRQSRVNSVIRDLGLQKCENSIIGVPNQMKSISGGERKRLAFASEMLANPAIMFCDEPTSGLDSFTAEKVVNALKNLANRGKTIVCTIHQPSSEIFALFDNLLLLAEGRVAYMGPSKGARSFFASVGYSCPDQFNPADFYIRTLAVTPGKEIDSRKRLKRICDCFITSSDEGKRLADDLKLASSPVANETVIPPLKVVRRSRFKASYATQLRLVGWRSFLSANKDTAVVGIRFMQNIFIALLSGLIYLNQQNDQKGVQNINGALFMATANMTFGNAFGIITIFCMELPLFKRDNENGTYRTSVYYICKSIADLPIFIINPIIFTAIMYWMIGLKPDFVAFLVCTATSIMLTNVVVSFGTMVSSLAGDMNIAMALAGPLLAFFLLFGGFLLNTDSIPIWLSWLSIFSWFNYANEMYLINHWHNFGPIGCEFGNNSSLCFKDGDAVLQSFSYTVDNLQFDFIYMAALFIGFRIVGFVALYFRANPVRFDKKSIT